jgi:hypothetical protein
VFVFDLQTGLATAMVEAQILEVFPHAHVDVGMMRDGEDGSTKPLQLQSKTVFVRGRDVLEEVLVVGVMVRSDRRAQTNIKKTNQKSKDRRTTDVKSEHKSSPVESEWMKRRKTDDRVEIEGRLYFMLRGRLESENSNGDAIERLDGPVGLFP